MHTGVARARHTPNEGNKHNAMTNDNTDTPTRISALIERLSRLTRGLQHANGIKPAQWEALRYLARANRFSRSPGALSEFLGSTRGTVSQTLIALEKKGLVKRMPSPRDGRGTALELTASGRGLVSEDPLLEVEDIAADLPDEIQESLAASLTEVLRRMQQRNGFRAFGVCRSCRFFRHQAGAPEGVGPHRCGLTGESLSEADSGMICREHGVRAA